MSPQVTQFWHGQCTSIPVATEPGDSRGESVLTQCDLTGDIALESWTVRRDNAAPTNPGNIPRDQWKPRRVHPADQRRRPVAVTAHRREKVTAVKPCWHTSSCAANMSGR